MASLSFPRGAVASVTTSMDESVHGNEQLCIKWTNVHLSLLGTAGPEVAAGLIGVEEHERRGCVR